VNRQTTKGLAMAPADYLRPVEVGEMVVCHVLEDVREPEPDFEAMRRMLGEPVPQTGSDHTR
jgi:hypothetical protein